MLVLDRAIGKRVLIINKKTGLTELIVWPEKINNQEITLAVYSHKLGRVHHPRLLKQGTPFIELNGDIHISYVKYMTYKNIRLGFLDKQKKYDILREEIKNAGLPSTNQENSQETGKEI